MNDLPLLIHLFFGAGENLSIQEQQQRTEGFLLGLLVGTKIDDGRLEALVKAIKENN